MTIMKKTIGLLVMLALLLCVATAVWSQEPPRQVPPDQQPPSGIERGVRPMPSLEGTTPVQGQRQQGQFRQRMGASQGCPLAALQLPPASMFRFISQRLQLPEDQSTKLLDIITKSEQTLTPLRTKAQEAGAQLRAALVADTYDAANVQSLAQNAQRAEAAIVTAQINTWTKIRSLLTAEQAKLFTEMIQNPMRMMGEGDAPGGQQPLPDRLQVEER